MYAAMVVLLLRAMRPRQWVKNLIIFAALVFDRKLFMLPYLQRTLAGFVLFSLLAGAVYLANDLADLEQDRGHPRKRKRPLAAGDLSTRVGATAALLIPLVVLPLAFRLHTWFGLVLALYWVQNLAYSIRLKNVVIIDVLLIALGFMLRVAAGAILVDVEQAPIGSPWIYMCVGLGALLIGLGKRRHELMLFAGTVNNHRAVLADYNLTLIDWFIASVTTGAIIAYSLYTFNAPNLPQNHLMMATIPFVIYGVFRYLYLIRVKGAGGAPERLVFRDRPLLVSIILWASAATAVMYLD